MSAFPLPLKASREVAPSWDNIDPATLPEDLQRHYRAYQKAQALANDARKLFESEANEAFDAGAGNRLAFGYKFGKLSVAIVPERKAASPSSTKSLASIVKLR